jgi:hypothetical protein
MQTPTVCSLFLEVSAYLFEPQIQSEERKWELYGEFSHVVLSFPQQ